MSVKVAIFYTGQFRTIRKALPFFKKNCLHDENHHVFAVLQNDNQDTSFLNEEMGASLKSLHLFHPSDSNFVQLKTSLVSKMEIPSNWKNYLLNSGSILEYYQMYLAFQDMKEFEEKNSFRYDFVIRIRCDCVLNSPLNLNFSYEPDFIRERLNQIRDKVKSSTFVNQEVISNFMTSLLSSNRVYAKTCLQTLNVSEQFSSLLQLSEEDFITSLIQYLKDGKFIIAFRANVIYALKREYADLLAPLALNYGKSRTYDDGYWFNSECQFKSWSLDQGLDYFDSVTTMEHKSLYEYNHHNYFNDKNELIEDPNIFFFLMRN